MKKTIFKRVFIFLAGSLLILILVSLISLVYPSMSEQQLEQALVRDIQHYVAGDTWNPDQFDSPQIIIWYPLLEDLDAPDPYPDVPYWVFWGFGEDPSKVWWFENGEWGEITIDKQEAIRRYLDNYYTDNIYASYNRFGFTPIEKWGLSYKANVTISWDRFFSFSICQYTFARGPFGRWVMVEYYDCTRGDRFPR